jgi:HD-GYP domain-containing protein (c-di-GMP phosphodiesterase class II)
MDGFENNCNMQSMGSSHNISRLGPHLVQRIFSASKTLQIHDLNNHATQIALSKLMETMGELFELEGRVTLTVSTDLLLINDERVSVDPQCMSPFLYLIDEMKKRKVEEIDFTHEIDTMELGAFLQQFGLDTSEEDVFGELNKRTEAAGITNVRITEQIERVKYLRDTKVERREIREESNKIMQRAILFMGEVMRAVEQKRPIQLPKAHRLTQQLSDIIDTDESILLGLASIKSYDEYTFSHSVNVSVHSMLIADRMELPKKEISQIGVAALFHDLGKMHVPQSILNKPEALTTGEWKLMERHPMLGVIELSRVRSLRMIVDPLFVSLQHHLQYCGEGYPQKPGRWKVHPYINIITTADIFDAITTPRIYRKFALTPDQALRFILHKSGKIFDPIIAKIFIKAMGIYPIGTVVELNDGEKAVVVRQNENTRLMHRPVVELLQEDGQQGKPVDLAETKKNGTSYKHTIVRSIQGELLDAQKASSFIMK